MLLKLDGAIPGALSVPIHESVRCACMVTDDAARPPDNVPLIELKLERGASSSVAERLEAFAAETTLSGENAC